MICKVRSAAIFSLGCLVLGSLPADAESPILFGGNGFSCTWQTAVSNGGDGFVTTSSLPLQVALTSSNNRVGLSETDFTMTAEASGYVEFSWSYITRDAPGFDPFGYLHNGVFHVQTSATQSQQNGALAVFIAQGDQFGFRQLSHDSVYGSATATIQDFSFTPVPEPGCLLCLTGGVLASLLRRRL
jgi:hypothetical protein